MNCDAHLQNPIQVKVHFDANKRVFVIGDLDADLAKFEQALKSVNFDKNHDVLFSLGDVIDRGADSVKLIKRFIELGVYMSLGNHEHMLLESLLTHDKDYFSLWVKNGGRWHIDTSDEELEFVCNYLRNRPLSYLLDYRGAKIGLSHTVSHNWNWLVGWYKQPNDGHPKALHYTEGGPWIGYPYNKSEYSELWNEYLNKFNSTFRGNKV